MIKLIFVLIKLSKSVLVEYTRISNTILQIYKPVMDILKLKTAPRFFSIDQINSKKCTKIMKLIKLNALTTSISILKVIE